MASAGDDYETRKRLLGWFVENHWNIDPASPVHPLKFTAQLEAASPSKARKGVEMAINDCVESTEHLQPDQVRKMDEELSASGLPTLSALRLGRSRQFKAAIKRGSIRTEAEYYALRSIVEGAIPEPDRAQLWALLEAFEERAGSATR